jgi:lipopolysaccharide export system protein LptA
MRTLVLAAGVLLVVALGVFLAVGKGKNPFNRRDLPQRLGIDIKQEANGFTYSQSHGGRTLFKIHASKVVQLKDNRAVLHDVKIELYGEDGSRVDRIEGSEFDYDQKTGTATASGPVEITLMRPGVAPAVAPKATPEQAVADKSKASPLTSAAQTAATGEIHVETSGLTFDQNSGVATTAQHVDFSLAQGGGSSMGASFDSQQGVLVLDRTVELNTKRGRETVQIHAQHAEFERDTNLCRLHAATAAYRQGHATAGDAQIFFRDDGSAVRLDSTNGFTLTTATGGHLTAPTGRMDFDEHNQPRHGHLEGGVTMDSESESQNGTRKVHGTAPTAELEFTAKGELRHAHLERGVAMDTEQQSEPSASGAGTGLLRVSRHWRSPVADVEFRDAGHGQIEPATIHGIGGVLVTGESQHGLGPRLPFRLSADDVTGELGPGSALTALNGNGRVSIEETTATGARETTSGDLLEAHFAQSEESKPGANAGLSGDSRGESRIQSATVDGHVVLTDEPAAKPGSPPQAPLHATAGHAVYAGDGEWLHLTLSPRVEDGGLQLTAVAVDVSRASGDAFAHGNVKASWIDSGSGSNGGQARPKAGATGQGSVALGGQGPAHAVSNDAQLHQATGETTFRGQARLWQQANSITAPVIVLDRTRQTLVARTTDPAEPVRAVLVSAAGTESARTPGNGPGSANSPTGKPGQPSVIRVRGGDLKYSDAERKAVMHAGVLGNVVAEAGTATSASSEVELTLLPPGNHAAPDGGSAQVDRMVARGRVVLTSEGRRGTGEQLVFTSENAEYVLTGTASVPPRMTDPARGTVTGTALIFHSRDDSVTVEGGPRKTTTETTAPKRGRERE